MMKKSSLPVLFFLLAALPAWCADTATATTVIEEVIVRINSDIVTHSELQRSKDEVR